MLELETYVFDPERSVGQKINSIFISTLVGHVQHVHVHERQGRIHLL